MSFFQRIRSPFGDFTEDQQVSPDPRTPAIGAILRARREELELDIASIGETLRIKPNYLAALEQGRIHELPGPAYAVGFVRAYANYLGLDGERVLDRYKAESADVHARPDLALPVPLGARSLPGGALVLVGLILVLCGYGTWYYLSTGERSRPERVAAVPADLQQQIPPNPAAAPANPAIAAATAQDLGPGSMQPRFSSGFLPPQEAPPAATEAPAAPGATGPALASRAVAAPAPPQPAPAQPATAAVQPPAAAPAPAAAQTASATSPPAAAGSGQPAGAGIDIHALADCWIQVRAADDQSIVFSRVLKAGESYHVPRAGLLLRTGNAGALAITVDGKAAPGIGGIGTLRRNVTLDPAALAAGTAVHG